MLSVEVVSRRRLRFPDGSPVRAASAVAPFGDGWLVAQDDAAHAAWVRPSGVTPIRVVPPVQGHDVFSSASGTKHLKPDFEAACAVEPGVLLLGSGSTDRRMRVALVTLEEEPRVAELPQVYARVAEVLGLDLAALNLEGACLVGESLRWFSRGNLSAGVPSASVDLPLAPLLAAVTGGDGAALPMTRAHQYDLGEVDGVGLTVTDAVALAGGRVLVSAAAEDTPNPVDDGPVVASALALLDGDAVRAVLALPDLDGRVAKVEGLALLRETGDGARLLAVVDDDDAEAASAELVLDVLWGGS